MDDVMKAVREVFSDAYSYMDASSTDASERWLILTAHDVVGAGPTKAAAWLDALNDLSSLEIAA